MTQFVVYLIHIFILLHVPKGILHSRLFELTLYYVFTTITILIKLKKTNHDTMSITLDQAKTLMLVKNADIALDIFSPP
jgi:hypothetical protein